MTDIVKRNARAILLDGDELVLIKRTKPGREPYWVSVGGGVEADDATIEAALHREVFEELGGKLERAELVHLITDQLEAGIGVQHIFAARLESMDLAARTGTEFAKPERGGYEVVRVPFTAEAVRGLNLMPPELAEFIAANTDAIVSVLDTPIREARAMAQLPDFVSLNGPDNVGKTTHLVRLAERGNGFQPLGAVHEHDPEPWARVAAGHYARWWFETSTTVELTELLLAGHAKRAAAREAGRTGLLDRGLPMLLAVAAATCVVKDGLTVGEAFKTVTGIAGSRSGAPETSVLLLPSLDAERSYAITSAREGRPWTGIYPAYQKTLHSVLLHQANLGAYNAVVDCEGRSLDDVHADVLGHIGLT